MLANIHVAEASWASAMVAWWYQAHLQKKKITIEDKTFEKKSNCEMITKGKKKLSKSVNKISLLIQMKMYQFGILEDLFLFYNINLWVTYSSPQQ